MSITVNAQSITSVVPVTLGFHPADSIVVIGLLPIDGKRILGPVARIDLDQTDSLSEIGQAFGRHTDQVIVVVYSDDPYAVLEVNTALIGLTVIDVLAAGNAPTDLHPAVSAEAAVNGRAVLTDREQLAASVASRPEAAITPALDRLRHRLTVAADRDAYLLDHTGTRERSADQLPDLISALAATPADHPALPDLAATAAVIAYRSGDGALANVALDRALDAGGTNLARLLDAAIRAGISPDALADALTGKEG